MAKIGDTVRFLNDVGGGTVVRIDGKIAYVRDPQDGFETPMPLNELIVVPGTRETYTDPSPHSDTLPLSHSATAKPLSQSAPAFSLLFEPKDIRRLSQTDFDLYLINDSAYKIYFAVSSRDEDASEFTLIQAAEAEPGMKVFLDEVPQDELNFFRHVLVQIIAFKTDGDYQPLQPIDFRTRLDLTRLAKLHCFTSTAYSTAPVLTLSIPADFSSLSSLSSLSSRSATSPLRHSVKSEPSAFTPKLSVACEARAPRSSSSTKDSPEVVDLHIHELLDSTAGLQPADMLAYQLDVFDKKMEAAAKHPGSKIIFIHGKGEGVLRAAIIDRLRKRWPRCDVQDASFREYGFGATQVTIRR